MPLEHDRPRTTTDDDRRIPASAAAAEAAALVRADRFALRTPSPLARLAHRARAHAERLLDAARADVENGLALPLLVVVFACGIALYFVLPDEPWAPAPIALAVALFGATWIARRRGRAARLLAVATALALGMAVAVVGARRVAAPRLDHERTVTVTGRVVDVDTNQRGGTRMGLIVDAMDGRGLTPATTPTAITATLTRTRDPAPSPGDGVRFKARLKPPEGPVLPGGYDFARRAWFEGRGASGYVLGRVEPVETPPPTLAARALAEIGTLRHAVAERVRATLPGAPGAIGAALMVGEQRAIPEKAAEPLRASGLTHIVSIAGLHMSLVAGGVIVAVRLMLVLFPALALRISAKKWAAVAAFAVATVYLLLSGNQVAALRSHLMLSIALLAVVVDRPAITMHTIAVSAVLILVWDPSAVMEPSFLMSYLAVIALVAGYDLWRLWSEHRPPPAREAGPIAHGVHAAWRHVQGLAFSSLVAGLATAPVIAGVFYRGAPYSILANMLVLPVTGLLIMPAAVLAALAMPFGLDAAPLWAMGKGIEIMIAVAEWTAALPGGAGLIGAPHGLAEPLGIAAVLWLSLWRSHVRLLALIPAVLSALLLFAGARPDVIVGRHGESIAVRSADGRLAVLADRRDRFDVAIWLAADADSRSPDDRGLREGWRCDPLGCTFSRPDPNHPAGDLLVAVVRRPEAFAEDCRRAALVVTILEAPPGCAERTTVIDRRTLATTGALTLERAAPEAATTARPEPLPRPAPVDPTTDPTTDSTAEPLPGARDAVASDPDEIERIADETSSSVSRAPSSPGVETASSPRPATTPSASTETPSSPRPAPPASVNSALPRLVAEHGAPSPLVAEPPLSSPPEPDITFWNDDAPPPRTRFHATPSLPRFARPWTPRDPSSPLLAAPATAAEAPRRDAAPDPVAVDPDAGPRSGPSPQ